MLRLYLFVGHSDQESRLHKYKELIIISFTQFEINKFLMFVFVVYSTHLIHTPYSFV